MGGKSSSTREETQLGRLVLSEILQKVLLPLHLQNGMLEWRDQVPIIKVYTYLL